MTLLLKDSKDRPTLFNWYGPIDKNLLSRWLQDHHLDPPSELVEFWISTGGGDFFESETLLTPLGDTKLGDDLLSVNDYHWNRGLSRMFLIFHVGLGGLTAICLDDDSIVTLDAENYQEGETYPSISEWYERLIRSEYADRYGLTPTLRK